MEDLLEMLANVAIELGWWRWLLCVFVAVVLATIACERVASRRARVSIKVPIGIAGTFGGGVWEYKARKRK